MMFSMYAFHGDLTQGGSYLRETEAESAEEAASKAELRGGKKKKKALTDLMDSVYSRKRGRIRGVYLIARITVAFYLFTSHNPSQLLTKKGILATGKD